MGQCLRSGGLGLWTAATITAVGASAGLWIGVGVPSAGSARRLPGRGADRSPLQRLSAELGNRSFGHLVARTRACDRVVPSGVLDGGVEAATAASRVVGRPLNAGASHVPDSSLAEHSLALARVVSARAATSDFTIKALNPDEVPVEGTEGKSLNPNEVPVEDIEGKSLNPNEVPVEGIEGRPGRVGPGPSLHRRRALATRTLQRLTITQVTPDSDLRRGTCGERNVQWIFALDKPAPEDGYIVQHIQGNQDIAACPGPRSGKMTQTSNFWEAWPIKKGDLVDWTTTRDGWTDGSTRAPAAHTVGEQVSDGEVKFFVRSKTGDLGDFNQAPADPASKWGPGKVPTSGALPSTPTKPPWWDDAPIEGPAVRQARSEWDCCDADPSKHTSHVTAYPPRPERCEVKDWFN
jgi:hypothetical protein